MTLDELLAAFDVRPHDGGFTAEASPDGGRQVVDGSQILAQSIVAVSKSFPDKAVRTAHALFVAAADPAKPIEFTVTPVKQGRSFTSATATATQQDRICATVTVLLDHPQADVIRHDRWTGPPVKQPEDAFPATMPLPGRELRLVDVRDHNDPDEVGPPELNAWLRYDTVPERDDLRRALLAHFTGHLSISTTMRAHAGIGTAQAHHTVSTAVMSIGVSFHDPIGWDGWIRYHHESSYAGSGMSYVRGQVLAEDDRLLASFTQDAMLRAVTSTASEIPAESRL